MADLALAVVGPTSLIGEEILEQLESRRLDVDVRLLGSHRTAGGEVAEGAFAGRIALLAPSAFDGIDIALFAAGPTVAGEWAPEAARAGALVVDCSSRFRLDPQVPLVVPEVNADALADVRERGIVATPSSTAIALSVVLAPLAQAVGLRRVVVSTYHGVAGAGRRAVHGLSRETVDLLNGRGQRATAFARRIAFNCLPQVGALEPGGASAHESAAVEEVRRILDAPGLAMHLTAVRVPVFFGVGLSVAVETDDALDPGDAAELLRPAPGILLHDTPGDPYSTPVEAAGSEATHVGRVRADPSVEHGLALWVTIDSVVKGAGLNAVQVAELLARNHL